MKSLPVALFFSGLAIQFGALLGEHAAEIPFVLKRVAPSYWRAQTGVETLLKKRRLEKTDIGFEEVSRFLIWNMYEINHIPKSRETDHKAEAISCMGETRQEGTSNGDELYTPDD